MTSDAKDGSAGLLENLSKTAALLLGVFYVIGLIIVNSELALYGVSSMDLARPEYVLTGALWAFLTLLPVVVVRYYRALFLTDPNQGVRSFDVVMRRVAFSLGAVFTLLFFLEVLSDYEITPFGRNGFWNFIDGRGATITLITAVVISYPGVLLTILYDKWIRGLQRGNLSLRELADPPHLSFNLAYNLTTLLSQISLYVIFVYPHLDMKFGGGKHPNVDLLLSRQVDLPWSANQITVSKDGLKVGPALLLLETQDAVVITRPRDIKRAWSFSANSDAFLLRKADLLAYRFIGNQTEESSDSTSPLQPASGQYPGPTPTKLAR